MILVVFFFFSSRRRHTRWTGDWSSDVCSSDLFHLAFLFFIRSNLCMHLLFQCCIFMLMFCLCDMHIMLMYILLCIQDRKSTRLNSSHPSISYAVFCLKKKKKKLEAIILNKY